jgi:hypothetical protein
VSRYLTEPEAWREISRIGFDTGSLGYSDGLCAAVARMYHDEKVSAEVEMRMVSRVRDHLSSGYVYLHSELGHVRYDCPEWYADRAMFALLLAEEAETGL